MEDEKKLKFEFDGGTMESAGTVDTNIKVMGVGGCGCNIVNAMCELGLNGAELIAVNTEKQSLNRLVTPNKIQIGKLATGGRGAGSDPKKGMEAAEEDRALIESVLDNTQMLFIAAGLGNGTGTGASPVIADIARAKGILTIAVLITPFDDELDDKKRMIIESSLDQIKGKADAIITISNQKISEIYEANKVMKDAYMEINKFLIKRIDGVIRMITVPGIQNIDFADVQNTVKRKGNTFIGIGRGSGTDRARKAFEEAINNPILNTVDMKGAKGILVNFTGQITIQDRQEIANLKKKYTGENVSVKFGMVDDETLGDDVEVTILISGIRDDNTYYTSDTEKYNHMSKMAMQAIENGYEDPYLEMPTFERMKKIAVKEIHADRQGRVDN